MKKLFFTYLFIYLFIYSESQNLVPNYSFENCSPCPNASYQISYASPWYSPTAGTTDYFNSCGTIGYKTPLNIWGYQFPKTGNAYAEIAVYGSISSSSVREYVQVPLSDTLVADHLYCVSFYVSHTGISSFASYTPIAITEIGLLFSNNAIITSNDHPLAYTPQITSPVGVVLNDTVNWTKISGVYTAIGGERFITIGNFKDDASTDTLVVGNPGFDPQGYYYVDDVSVINCDSLMGVNETLVNPVFSIFPNPNNGSITLKYTLKQSDKASMKIYNVTGKLIGEASLDPNESQIQIATNLDKGIYLYQIIVNDRIVKSDKMVIIK